MYRDDRIAVLLSGRSDNLQNKKHYSVARVQIGDEYVDLTNLQYIQKKHVFRETSNTTWNLQISMDPANTNCSLDIMEGRGGYSLP